MRASVNGDGSSGKLRVVYLDHVANLSGGELALLRLLSVLRDVEPHVVLAEDGPLAERLIQAGISVEVLPMQDRTRELRRGSVQAGRLPLRAILDTLSYALRLAWRLRQLRPDVVGTNSLKSGIYGSIAARLAGAAVVWHLHDRIDTDYLPRSGVMLVRMLVRRLPHVVVSNSRATKNTLSRCTRSLVIPPVMAIVRSSPQTKAQKGPFVAGMVGRLAPWKGQDVFLRAFAQAFPEGAQRAVIIGAPLFGAAEVVYADELRRLAADLGIAHRVEFRGHREDIAGELRSIDVLVHASVAPEPFGQVLVEGMSAHLPVVASRAGGPEEIITDGTNGMLYSPGDAAALARILVRLEAEPTLRARLGEAASQRARDFSPESVAEQVMDAYILAVARSGSRRSRPLAAARRPLKNSRPRQ